MREPAASCARAANHADISARLAGRRAGARWRRWPLTLAEEQMIGNAPMADTFVAATR